MENVTEAIGKALHDKFGEDVVSHSLILDFPTFVVKKRKFSM